MFLRYFKLYELKAICFICSFHSQVACSLICYCFVQCFQNLGSIWTSGENTAPLAPESTSFQTLRWIHGFLALWCGSWWPVTPSISSVVSKPSVKAGILAKGYAMAHVAMCGPFWWGLDVLNLCNRKRWCFFLRLCESICIHQVLPSDLFGCFKWPFQGLSDLHLGAQKVTWKKLAYVVFLCVFHLLIVCEYSSAVWGYCVILCTYAIIYPRRRLARAWHTVLVEYCSCSTSSEVLDGNPFWIIMEQYMGDMDIGSKFLVQLFAWSLCFCSPMFLLFLPSPEIPDPLATPRDWWQRHQEKFGKCSFTKFAFGPQSRWRFLSWKGDKVRFANSRQSTGICCFLSAVSPPKTTRTLIKHDKMLHKSIFQGI